MNWVSGPLISRGLSLVFCGSITTGRFDFSVSLKMRQKKKHPIQWTRDIVQWFPYVKFIFSRTVGSIWNKLMVGLNDSYFFTDLAKGKRPLGYCPQQIHSNCQRGGNPLPTWKFLSPVKHSGDIFLNILLKIVFC